MFLLSEVVDRFCGRLFSAQSPADLASGALVAYDSK